MKKILSIALGLISMYGVAQQTISFETSEGYQLGDINSQNGWTVTETSDGPLTNQVISAEQAKTGIYSFKNAHVLQYEDQWFPIFGIEKSFAPALDYKNTTISYDFMAPQQGGSDFEFAVYSINVEEQVFDTVLAVGFENRGYIYLYPEMNFGGFMYANQNWVPNTWYNLKVKFTEETITFYLNDVVMHEAQNTSKVNIDGLNFLHNNFGGDAYYDNITVSHDALSTGNDAIANAKLYPNPVTDVLNIALPQGEKLDQIEIYNFSGQKILTVKSEKEIQLKALKSGVYLVKATNANGKVYTSKIIKK